ncbi:hypothetical protein [Bacillus ndiopicus]|uniref:hypothetical protein n=1 Tax=Bacillus ndiopicus TaxID=1347368 RepID=UPI0005A8E097|nr:hypothetical protein [Bacillus ndiopicus]
MQELIRETMESYNNYIINVKEGALKIADKLRTEDIKGALTLISDFSEGSIWLVDVNKKLMDLGYLVKLEMNVIQEFLIEINEGLENQDYILVADIFEYEISPFFDQLEQYEI